MGRAGGRGAPNRHALGCQDLRRHIAYQTFAATRAPGYFPTERRPLSGGAKLHTAGSTGGRKRSVIWRLLSRAEDEVETPGNPPCKRTLESGKLPENLTHHVGKGVSAKAIRDQDARPCLAQAMGRKQPNASGRKEHAAANAVGAQLQSPDYMGYKGRNISTKNVSGCDRFTLLPPRASARNK